LNGAFGAVACRRLCFLHTELCDQRPAGSGRTQAYMRNVFQVYARARQTRCNDRVQKTVFLEICRYIVFHIGENCMTDIFSNREQARVPSVPAKPSGEDIIRRLMVEIIAHMRNFML